MDTLCTEQIDRLSDILADDFVFHGPWHSYYSAADYCTAMKQNPPHGWQFSIINQYEDQNSACLIYWFRKAQTETRMAQNFTVHAGKIHASILVFDTQAFIDSNR